jgi:hypothetical protein
MARASVERVPLTAPVPQDCHWHGPGVVRGPFQVMALGKLVIGCTVGVLAGFIQRLLV